jgi:hypothetical protein
MVMLNMMSIDYRSIVNWLMLCFLPSLILVVDVKAQKLNNVEIIPVGQAWASNSINTAIFRRNSLVTYKDTQYIAYYDIEMNVVLGKRNINALQWELKTTNYKGNTTDAHRTISIMVDGEGYLHLSWDHHNNLLNYCRSINPCSLEMGPKLSMTGNKEKRITYPEFYHLANGNLLFLYRDGGSGNGDLMLNQYDTKQKKWRTIQDGWVDGEGERNPYWQMFVAQNGTIYLSWVWRETPKVESNHDICFAKSEDGGLTWLKSNEEQYKLPITVKTAEYALKIPQNSQLINSTSITSDKNGNSYTANYWVNDGDSIPQYRLLYQENGIWKTQQISQRKTAFSLSGSGTKRIPISRPLLITKEKGKKVQLYMFFRDQERGNKISVAINSDIRKSKWKIKDLTDFSVGLWEPTFDSELWKNNEILNLFVENVEQGDGETLKELKSQKVSVLQWKIK